MRCLLRLFCTSGEKCTTEVSFSDRCCTGCFANRCDFCEVSFLLSNAHSGGDQTQWSGIAGQVTTKTCPQRFSLWRVLITHKLERIFFCLVLALESQAFFSNLSPSGFAQNEQLWLLHHLHCCHSIFNLSLEASPMQRSCRSSGSVQNVEWQ